MTLKNETRQKEKEKKIPPHPLYNNQKCARKIKKIPQKGVPGIPTGGLPAVGERVPFRPPSRGRGRGDDDDAGPDRLAPSADSGSAG